MVLVGEFELSLVCSNGTACPEVERNGQVYAVASPGTSFSVHFTEHPNPFAAPMPNLFHIIELRVDGQHVGYNRRLRQPGTAIYKGFLQAGDTSSCTYRSFVFAKPQETEDKQADSLNFVEGTIRAEVWLAMQTAIPCARGQRYGPATANDSVAKMPEGKKFFMAPSLVTGKGEITTSEGFSPFQWKRVGPTPIATLELRYETAATLLLRGLLKRDNPEHHAILQQFPDTAHKNEPEEVQQQAGSDQGSEEAAGPSHAPARHGLKRQRHAAEAQQLLQVQPQQPQRQQQQEAEAEVVDLTRAPAARDEVLAAKVANKTLECDLTADDEPHWRAVKKPVHRV